MCSECCLAQLLECSQQPYGVVSIIMPIVWRRLKHRRACQDATTHSCALRPTAADGVLLSPGLTGTWSIEPALCQVT